MDVSQQEFIMERITTILRSSFPWLNSSIQINSDSRFVEDLRLDSINLVTLQVAVEDMFQFRYDPAAEDFAVVFSSVGSMVLSVDCQLKLRATGSRRSGNE
jgi:acyl carrier protein